MEANDNPFVKPLLQSMFAIERDIIRLYAESCYTNIQAAQGNLSCMERIEGLADALCAAEQRLYALQARLRRIGVPRLAMAGLDSQQRLSLFEAEFKRHDAVFTTPQAAFDRQQLSCMLEDIANIDPGG
jgi:hypothetical protein